MQYSSDASLCYWTTVDEANIPSGTEVKYAVRTAKDQLLIADHRPSGGVQYLFSELDTNWITEIRSFVE